MMRRLFLFHRFLPVLAPMALLLLATACIPHPESASPSISQTADPDSDQFVGNAACAECHQSEFDLHRGTRHANTIHPADPRSLGSQSPPTGPIPNSIYAIRETAGTFRFERSDDPTIGAPLRFALGGKYVMTYIGEFGKESLTEFRMTYSPPLHAFCVTPGQRKLADLNLGRTYEMGLARGCILCHAIKRTPGSSEPAPGFLGVGCESCHGPGKEHIIAEKSGKDTASRMEDMSQWGAAKINAVCARCHRSIDVVTLDGEDAKLTTRFQDYGLELSRCFKESGDRLSCITCHDPHSDVSTDRHYYEKICLTCHTPSTTGQAKACPVNPKELCIGCHMPKRPINTETRVPILMADHLIQAYRTKK
jgi:predicted CXXCH cytochrome family protein